MPINALIDARRMVTLSTNGTVPVSVTATQSGNTLTFTSSDGTVNLPVPLGWSGISVDAGITLTISATLVAGKAVLGAGTAIALAPLSGGDVSGLALYTDIIQLTSGQAYTLTSTQATMARIDSGTVGNLTSAGAISVLAQTAGDLSALTLDTGDTITLTAGFDYTLTAAQALIAKVGTGNKGVLTSTGILTIKASTSADLTGITTDSNDTIILTQGVSYTLSSSQVAISKVGGGNKGDLTTAGTILVRASSTGDANLFAMTGTGVDIIQLTAGQAYTLTPAQVPLTRVGATGSMGNLTSSGVITIKADAAAADLSTIVSDSNDVFLLGAGLPYTLTSQQAAKAKVVSGSTQGNSGDLRNAGFVTVVANTTGENLAATTVQGVDLYILNAGSDYVLTSAQAKYSKVGAGGTVGSLGTAGLVSIRASTAEDFTNTLTAANITGYDLLLLSPAVSYTLNAEQARMARLVDSSGLAGKSGALTSTGVITVRADAAGGDLTGIGTDSNDVIVLGAGMTYTLTAAQAVSSTVATGSGSGSLSKAANLTVMAPSTGGDLSALVNVTGIQSVLLTPGQKYTIPTALASVVKVSGLPVTTPPTPPLTGAGPLTVVAATGGDLTGNSLALAASGLLLTAGQNYTLTAAQAALSRFSSTAALGDLRQTGAAKPGTVTVDASSVGTSPSTADLSNLLVDTNVNYLLGIGKNYTLTAAQALRSTVAGGAAGDLSAAGTVIVKAPNLSTPALDLSSIVVSPSDTLVLSQGGNYVLSKAQVPLARVVKEAPGVSISSMPGDLSKAGVITVYAAPGDNLTSLSSGVSGIDFYQLTAGANYTLTNGQAALSKVGTGAAGVLTSTGVLTIVAAPGADLTGLLTDSNDIIQLTSGANYTLTPAQALTAQLVTTVTNVGTSYGALGQLDSTGQITIRVPAVTPIPTATTDLSTALSTVTGVDNIVLNAGQPFTLSGAQAGIAQIGTNGTVGDLTSSAVITIIAGSTQNLAAFKTDSNDVIQLTDATDYTLTAAQAAVARIGAAGKAGTLTSTGSLRILAPVGADLSTLSTDANDAIVLWPGQRYTLTTAQAATARMYNGNTDGAVGDLSTAGSVRLIASNVAKASEDLTGLKLESSDVIQLTTGVNYTLSAQQASIAQIGATGKLGDMVGATPNTGNIKVVATGSADLSGITLDTAGDQIVLSAMANNQPCNYTLTPAQLGIAQVDTGAVGDFTAAGTVVLRASVTGDDLTTPAVLAAQGIDIYQLAPMQNYTLLSSQVPKARVGSGPLNSDLSAAGVVTVKADATADDLSTLANIKGLDAFILTPGAGYTLTPAQALVAKMGSTGTPGVLSSTGKISIVASTSADLSSIITDSNDLITLYATNDYTLNAAQLGVSKVITTSGNTVTTSPAGDLSAAGTITLRADSSADLSGLTAIGVDAIALNTGRDYTLNSAQAQIASVIGSSTAPGVLNKAGVVIVKPTSAGENLITSLASVTGYDILQLNDTSAYTLSAAQAALARIGTQGAVGNLASTGVLTVNAPSSADLTGLTLDSNDILNLNAGTITTITTGTAPTTTTTTTAAPNVYNLTAQEASIARVTTINTATVNGVTTTTSTTSLPGQLAHAVGTINVIANPKGEDLSGMIASGLDAIILTVGQTYKLTTAQALIAKVATAPTTSIFSKTTTTLTGINGTNNAELLVGATSNDTITGNGGNDTLTGGGGSDMFVFAGNASGNGSDTITDFAPANDVLDISTFLTLNSPLSLTSVSAASPITAVTGNVYVFSVSGPILSNDYSSIAAQNGRFANIFGPVIGTAFTANTNNVYPSIKDILVVQGTDVTKVYYVDNSVDGNKADISTGDVGLVATLTGITTAAPLQATNFM